MTLSKAMAAARDAEPVTPLKALQIFRQTKQYQPLRVKQALQAIHDEIKDVAVLRQEGGVTDAQWARFLKALGLTEMMAANLRPGLKGGFSHELRNATVHR